MLIRCEELFLCGIVPDCVSMRIKCSELFLIVSACELLCVLDCSCMLQNANYSMYADLFPVFVSACMLVFYLGIELLLS
jgi:hypothetical protein